eukprot:2088465-Amphidinium_carterae.1
MGMGPAAGWAQCCTDVSTKAAAMPEESRAVDGAVVPLHPPLWGSILDDVWAIDEQQPQGMSLAQRWMESLDQEWPRIG